MRSSVELENCLLKFDAYFILQRSMLGEFPLISCPAEHLLENGKKQKSADLKVGKV